MLVMLWDVINFFPHGDCRISRCDRAGRVSGWLDSGKQLSMGRCCIDVLELLAVQGSCYF
jgi:hypothetical protein